jgi:hypothetical protein
MEFFKARICFIMYIMFMITHFSIQYSRKYAIEDTKISVAALTVTTTILGIMSQKFDIICTCRYLLYILMMFPVFELCRVAYLVVMWEIKN